MSHSHLPIQHLLKRIETRVSLSTGPVRPVWITDLVNAVAELFDPFTDIGRVGFECRLTDDRWEVGLYLGRMEIVGGKDDGNFEQVDFRFDMLQLQALFDDIRSFYWNAFPADASDPGSRESSFLSLEGVYLENPVRVRVFCTPPPEAGPGLRYHSDGSWETV